MSRAEPSSIRLVAITLLISSLLLASCGGGSTSGGTSDDEIVRPLPPATGDELTRRLRLGVEQLRRGRLPGARAQLESCAAGEPEHPEVLFQLARLTLAETGPDAVAAATSLLRSSLKKRPASVKTRRLLLELAESSGDAATRDEQAEALINLLGRLSQVELREREERSAGNSGKSLTSKGRGLHSPRSEVDRVHRAAFQLLRAGEYAPDQSVELFERLFAEKPDLAYLRAWYVATLIEGEVRVERESEDDLPPMSSKLMLDIVQSHVERAFDQLDPRSELGRELLDRLADVAQRMGDHDEAVARSQVLLELPGIDGEQRRALLSRQGLSRYKQGRLDEAVELHSKALADDDFNSSTSFGRHWLLHVAQEAAEVSPGRREYPFPLRAEMQVEPTANDARFVDVAPELGVDKLDGAGPSAWADYDRDGDFDLFAAGCNSYGVLYRNDGGRFTDVSQEAGLFHVQSGFSAVFVDYDNDGWPDLSIGRDGWNGPSRNSLYRNAGNGRFVGVTDEVGLGDAGSSFVQSWLDYDRDGRVDLYLANGITLAGDTNRLYRNREDGRFENVTILAGLQEAPGTRTIGSAVGDYDQDGWPDLFVSGFMTRNRLYRNQGDGTFEEVAQRSGVAGADAITTGYVAFFFDHDGDGDPDLLKTALAPWSAVVLSYTQLYERTPKLHREGQRAAPRLYRNDGGFFTDVTEFSGIGRPAGIMGAGVADLDNDGDVDVYFGTGDPKTSRLEPDRYFRNDGDGTFTDLTFGSGLGSLGKGHGVTFVDVDEDGDLEIYAPEGGFDHGDLWPNHLYRNDLDSGAHWLHVDLEGVESNRDAIDARLLVEAGGRRFLREVKAGEGFGSSSSPTVEFGLGRIAKVDRLRIHWPSGQEQVFEDVPIDARVFVREGEPWTPWSRSVRAP
ncbi:MAG: FG-GAP-like repeat-containing protein [Acidobacteriota bacterium]